MEDTVSALLHSFSDSLLGFSKIPSNVFFFGKGSINRAKNYHPFHLQYFMIFGVHKNAATKDEQPALCRVTIEK
jgi:hypothetical protein